MDIKRITPEEAKQLLDSGQGYIYLDVRTVQEYEGGHVPGAKNIPVVEPDAGGRMQANPHFLPTAEKNLPRDAKIITGCKAGGRSIRAAEILLANGYTAVVDMRGGFIGEMDQSGHMSFPGWQTRGLPTTRDATPDQQYANLKK